MKTLLNIKKASISLLAILMLFSSCNEDSILEEVPLDFFSPETAYTNESGVIQGLSAIHGRIRDAYYSCEQFTTANWRAHGSDLAFNGELPNRGTAYLLSYQDLTPTLALVVDTWTQGFRIIQWANVLISKIEILDPSVFAKGEAGKNAYLAEARFLRSFMYRYLVSTFGDIPLIDEPVTSAKVDFTRDPIADIHNLMVNDFTFAATYLPKPGEEATPGRITQGPAWHYLAETYLEMKNPQAAVDAATHIVNDYHYALMQERFGVNPNNNIFGSGDVFYDLFGFGNQNLPENTEAMWVVQFTPPPTLGGGKLRTAYFFGPRYFNLGNTPDGFPSFYGTGGYENAMGGGAGYLDTLSRPTANNRGTDLLHYKIWQSDWHNDIRNAEHNIKRNYYWNSPNSAYNGQKIDLKLYTGANARKNLKDDTLRCLFPTFMKFCDPCHYLVDPTFGGNGTTHKCWYALRFSETLLLRAEAYLGINRSDLAAADVNVVRNRAKANPVSAADIDIDYVLDERARELYGEEWRLIILRRTGKLIERVRKYYDVPGVEGADIQDHNLRWPIPQTQIDLNVGASFPQNPGYDK